MVKIYWFPDLLLNWKFIVHFLLLFLFCRGKEFLAHIILSEKCGEQEKIKFQWSSQWFEALWSLCLSVTMCFGHHVFWSQWFIFHLQHIHDATKMSQLCVLAPIYTQSWHFLCWISIFNPSKTPNLYPNSYLIWKIYNFWKWKKKKKEWHQSNTQPIQYIQYTMLHQISFLSEILPALCSKVQNFPTPNIWTFFPHKKIF